MKAPVAPATLRDGIFISYRRDDARGASGRLYDWLRIAFGREKVFRDVASIGPGKWRRRIDAALAAYRKDLAIAEALVARDPANTQWQVDLALSAAKLGMSASLGMDERRLQLARGRTLLTALKVQGRLLPNQDWIGWFDQQLAALK